MRVRYTLEARSHIAKTFAYIAADSPAAATRVVKRIRDAAERLAEFPHLGRPGRAPHTRERVTPGLPYILVYKIRSEDDEVLILGVFHGARDR